MSDFNFDYIIKTIPPQSDDWEDMLKSKKIKDNGLVKALDAYWKCREDEYDKAIGLLATIQKLVADFKKSKEFAAAGAEAAKVIDKLIAKMPELRKDWERRKQEFVRTAMLPMNVQIIVTDWSGKPVGSDFYGYAEFKSPGAKDVNTTEPFGNGILQIEKMHLRPSGSLYLWVRDAMANSYMEGDCDYDFRPGKDIIKFKAVQFSKNGKVRAKTIEEATEKMGIKATVGVEFKVLSIGGEVSKESEYKKGFEQEVEWELEYGFKTLKDFKQL